MTRYSKKIVEWIEAQLNERLSERHIREKLKAQGHSHEEIEAALREVRRRSYFEKHEHHHLKKELKLIVPLVIIGIAMVIITILHILQLPTLKEHYPIIFGVFLIFAVILIFITHGLMTLDITVKRKRG